MSPKPTQLARAALARFRVIDSCLRLPQRAGPTYQEVWWKLVDLVDALVQLRQITKLGLLTWDLPQSATHARSMPRVNWIRGPSEGVRLPWASVQQCHPTRGTSSDASWSPSTDNVIEMLGACSGTAGSNL
jgi:hypothetical protein